MISLTRLSEAVTTEQCRLAQLVSDTKKIFQIVKRRKSQISRAVTLETLVIFREQHEKTLEEEDQLVCQHSLIQHSSWSSLRSFFIRFRFRLAEIQQITPQPANRLSSTDFISGIDQLTQELLQKNPVNTGRFLTYVFDFYRQAVVKKIQALDPTSIKIIPNANSQFSNFTANSQMLKQKRPSLLRINSCNQKLFDCWASKGRANYQPLGIDPSLKQIYFFSRDQEENSSLMYEEMMSRNKGISENIRQYREDYKKHQNWSRILTASQQKTVVRRAKKDKNISELKEVSPEKIKAKPTNRLLGLMGRTGFRIRFPAERSSKLLDLPKNLAETLSNFPQTPRRQHKIPSTVKIEFRSIRGIDRL